MRAPSGRVWYPHAWLVVLIAVVGFDTPRAAQRPSFRSDTRLIVETVSVKGKDGRTIEGLTAKDFVITEDNEPQTISFVEFQRLESGPRDSAVVPDSIGSGSPRPEATVPSTPGLITIPPPGD